MTEAQWRDCTDPRTMLALLRRRVTSRKGRLFHAACCRRAWHLLDDGPLRTAVELAEGYADGLVSAREMLALRAGSGASAWMAAKEQARRASQVVRCEVLRDLFGPLPFRPVVIPAVVLGWDAGTVLSLAWAAYEERLLPSGELDPARLGLLADALEDAGCTNEEALAHLRGPGPHARGCWVLDLVLGRA